jgi:hypothetical protein
VPEPDGVADSVEPPEGLFDGVMDCVAEDVPVTLGVADPERVPVRVEDSDDPADAVRVPVPLLLGVADGVRLVVGVADGVGLVVAAPESERVEDGEDPADAV